MKKIFTLIATALMAVSVNAQTDATTYDFAGITEDRVTVNEYGTSKRGHVKGYTEHQIIHTYEWPTIIVSAQGLHDCSCSIDFIHCTPVYKIEKREEI